MQAEEVLVLRNILNGVEPSKAALAVGMAEARGLEIFTEAMQRVREYQFVMCHPHFAVDSIAEVRVYRVHVLAILDAMGRWDDHEREVVTAIFKGRNVVKLDGVPREDAERILSETLKALPHYLTPAEIATFRRDPARFVKEHNSSAIRALESFPSLREPLQYKNIVTYTGGVEGLVNNLRQL